MEEAETALARVAKASPGLVGAATRQLLILQSSNWPFLIENGAVRDTAEARIAFHDAAPRRLVKIAERKRPPSPPDEKFLAELGERDRLFGPELGT